MAVINNISSLAVPMIILVFVSFAAAKKTSVYDAFISGAEDGLVTLRRIFPVLLAILVAAAMLRASGLMDLAVSALSPITDKFNIPPETVPLALLRPISGGGSIGLLTELLNTYGPDSPAGRMASVMAGSTETTFYTLAVYYSATRVKYTRPTLAAALIGDCVGIIGSAVICNILF